MRNIWTIAKREYDHYFISPIAYVVAFLILLTTGGIFVYSLSYFTQSAYQAYGGAPDITPVTGSFGFLLVLTIPAITMRLIADEARMGTLELLLTSPVRDFELVAGKWLGGVPVHPFHPGCDIDLSDHPERDCHRKRYHSASAGRPWHRPAADVSRITSVSSWRPAAFLAIGVGISAIFTNQIAAFFVTLVTFVILWWLFGFPASCHAAGQHRPADFPVSGYEDSFL